MVYTRIYDGIFGHLPPTSGVSFRRIMNEIGYARKDRGKVLLVCLDDANYLLHEGVLNNTLYSILRLYEEFQGLRTRVVLPVSNIDTDFQRELNSCVTSVIQPSEIYFSPYNNAEVEDP
jgi:cell division control protein 6